MAANWWKYGLCGFAGLGIGFAVGVKVTKNRAEEETEQKIADIREIYRNDRRASKPKKPSEDKKEPERPEISTKTSIDMEKLSERRKNAEQAERRYGQAFKESDKPTAKPKESEAEAEEVKPDEDQNWSDYIHVVSEFPQDSTYRQEVLCYYMDGVLAYQVAGKKVPEEDIPHLVGEDTLKLLEEDSCNEVFVRNDLYRIDYTIIFRYQEWAEIEEEEPYKAEE